MSGDTASRWQSQNVNPRLLTLQSLCHLVQRSLLYFLRLCGSGPGCPICPVPRCLCLCLCVCLCLCLLTPSTMDLLALARVDPGSLKLCSHPPHLHILYHPSRFGGSTLLPSPSCSVQTRTRNINCKPVTQAGAGTMTNETVSVSSKRSSCHSVPGCVARSSHL